MEVHWKIRFLGGEGGRGGVGITKNQYIGGLSKKRGLG